MKNSRKWFSLFCMALMMSVLTSSAQVMDEAFRPQFHFSPSTGWMNDPNGLVYDNGEYHLFYQHNPKDTKWGPMHWGHAVSSDLIHWQHLPIALEPDKLGMIFSGSAVIDAKNTAGFGVGAMVAIFTHDDTASESQSLAYSTDHGRSWTKYANNPVLKAPGNIRNFRDPKVFWYTSSTDAGHWVMSLAAGSSILFYASSDLKNWTPTGGFGFGYGATCGVWETPDLFELPVDGATGKRWVLTVGTSDCAPAGGGGTQYFIGQFDGKTFKSNNPKNTVLWADYGADFYAAQSWNNAPDGRRIWASWMNNWRYADKIPTASWRGALSFPRELGLKRTLLGGRLTQQPISELEQLLGTPVVFENLNVSGNQTLENVKGEKLEIRVTLKPDPSNMPERFGIRVRVGKNEQTTVGFNSKESKLFVDRSHSGQTNFSPNFPSAHVAPLELTNGELRLRLLIDRSSLEVFSEDGLVSMTETLFPDGSSTGIELFTDNGNMTVSHLEIAQLNSVFSISK